jgi:PAP2 superfamily
VLQWAELREERASEILAQIENQHCFWGSIIPIHTNRMSATRELLEAAIQFAVYAEVRFKHEFACWRPVDYSVQVQPMITTPGHGSFPSGHCTQSYIVFEVLKVLLKTINRGPAQKSVNLQFDRLAARISTNRVIAGVHFPIDNVAGRLLGSVLGEFFCYLAGQRGIGVGQNWIPAWHAGVFDPAGFPASGEFDPSNQPLNGSKFYDFKEVKIQAADQIGVLSELWSAAAKECRLLQHAFN